MKLIPTAVSRTIARQGLLTQQNAPQLLFGAGVVGSVASTVLACRATLRLESVLEDGRADAWTARQIEKRETSEQGLGRYNEEDRKHDVAIIYIRTAAQVAKLYAPSLLLGAASIGCLTKSHNILQERNLALTAAYAAVDEAFKAYRERVIEKYGEDEDRKLRFDHEEVELYDEELGNNVKVVRAIGEPSMYARFFDEYSTWWSKEPEYNFVFLRSRQSYFNDILQARGHLFLNEDNEQLGLGHTSAGAVV